MDTSAPSGRVSGPGPMRLMPSGSKVNDTGLEFHFSKACVEPPRTDISAAPGTSGEEFAQ